MSAGKTTLLPSDRQINLLHASGLTILEKGEDGVPHPPCQLLLGDQIEVAIGAGETDGTDAGGEQVHQFALALGVRAPQAKLFEDTVTFVDKAIAVFVIGVQVGEAVTGEGAEQLAAIVDAAIAVTVQRQERAARGEARHAVALAIGIQIEIDARGAIQAYRAAVQVEYQRIFEGRPGTY